ncbi:hypothetical protein U0C82_08950 [Fulvimarina sp. 2208YS6-2-32]|uniref:Calcium-binding protein n=1 Tax=Fulvimarina uroteuthidis TaxID=3098149 RepID=A0ABU5I2E8_9HYPH|nr:hypothetical protein [Fulvimarina sp. 2208YS6-2-32]MDY8109270.1 hypothetical protein [Fulvimarina sp. 2208YS6-2-32]
MALLSGFDTTLSNVNIAGQAALAAFSGGAIPPGWSVVAPAQLGIAPQYQDGNYFTNGSASAIVLQQGNFVIVSFRGTDDQGDALYFPQLVSGTYIDNFRPLLSAVAAAAPAGTEFGFTGASLGAGAANQLASIASSAYGGTFAGAQFVAFASPNISNASGILNFGFENDPIYRVIANHGDNPSSLDNLVLATSEYMAGNYDGRHPYDEYAHNRADLAFDALGRLAVSSFYEAMGPDSVVIFDAHAGVVQDRMPGRESTGAFYLGETRDDTIVGRAGNDVIEGFGGNDVLVGGGGNDLLVGGEGVDTASYGGTANRYGLLDVQGQIVVTTASGEGTDRTVGIERFQFADRVVAAGDVPNVLEYVASHRDLITAFGTNGEAALGHFLAHGFAEGRQATFDALAYTASHADLIRAFGLNEAASAGHFITSGMAEGRQVTFDAMEYTASYTDLITAFGTNEAAAARHFIASGFGEGRRSTFDAIEYTASHADLIVAFGTNEDAATRHFVENGYREGRLADSFDARQYAANYADLRAAFSNGSGGYDEDAAALHFVRFGFAEGRTDDLILG